MAVRALITDELPDRLLFRPLATVLVRGLARTPITPNQITVVSALFGVASGVALATRHTWIFTILIGIMMTLDCADGQLARLRGGGDIWGRIADGIADYVTAMAFHVGLIIWLVTDHGWLPGLLWGVGAGVGMAWNAYEMDREKRRYRGDVDDVAAVQREHEAAHGLKRFFIGAFLPYASGVSHGAPITDRDAYRQRLRPAMALWLWLGPTTHYAVAAILIAFDQPLLYAVAAVILFNLMTVFAILLTRRLESTLPSP
jgi:phosphatidylglycerophosphate synthase